VTRDEIIQKLAPWRGKHHRFAWKPVVEPGDGSVTASKFCGIPWTVPYAPWPECGHCHQPLQLFLQLDLDDLPAELDQTYGDGLLQLFYCIRDECQGYCGWEPFADDLSRVRVVHPIGSMPIVSPQGLTFPPMRIVGWERFLDLPKPEEHRELGLKYTYDFKAGTVRLECEELGLVFDNIRDPYLAENIANASLGDKLGGWPAWVQNVDYPACRRCERQMVHVFPVDSEHNVPFMFGDAGCGHITQCPGTQGRRRLRVGMPLTLKANKSRPAPIRVHEQRTCTKQISSNSLNVAHFLSSTNSTTQQPRRCSPGSRQCDRICSSSQPLPGVLAFSE